MDALVDLVTGLATGPHGLDDLVRGGAPSSRWRSSFAETRLVAGVHPEHIERPRVLRTPRGHAHRHRPVLPIIRTFAQVVAGVGQMEHRWFVFYNIAGGVAWGTSMTWGGSLLGQAVPSIGDRIHIVAGVVILLLLTTIVVELARERRRRSA